MLIKTKVVVDDSSLKYLEQYHGTRGDRDPKEHQSQLDTARRSLAAALYDLAHPIVPTQKEDTSAVDREGDIAMQDTDGPNAGTPAEVVTIPITAEDELSDIPAEMRESVAKEISAFRERSNRRDLERLKREEEIESMERARNAGSSRSNRLASPPPSAPIGPAGGTNGIPLGPRDRSGTNVPSGPKGFGVQIPKDYQKGVTFVNGNGAPTVWMDREDEDSAASDEELERRRQEKRLAEWEKQFLDQERRWLNRERSRTAAIEREKNRDKEEDLRAEEAREAMAKRLREWNDDIEASRKVEDYYADRGAWIRSRAAFRTREVKLDEADRAAEEREKVRSAQQREQARGMADDFLARQAEELESRNQLPREPQRFKLSLGAAAQQKAQAATTRRTVAEVEGLLEDEEEVDTTAKRTLIPIKFDSVAEASGLTDEERAHAARQLAAEIPSDKEGLWKWDVKWEFVDESVLSEQLKPFVEKKIMEYLGVQEQMLVDVVEEHIRQRGNPQELVELLEEVCVFTCFTFVFYFVHVG
jgi:PWI domain